MADLLTIPYEDDYETTLAQAWNGSATTVYLKNVPTATTPSGSNYSYLVVDPWKSIMQVVKVIAWENVGNTATTTTATIKKGSGVNYSAVSHASWATVRFSNNYQFWADIQTSINTKLDQDWGNGIDYASTAARDAALWGDWVATKNYRNIKAGAQFFNYNLSVWQWQVVSTGTAPAFASQTAAGIVEAPTTPQQVAWTTTWETGGLLFSTPDYVKTVNDTAVAEALKIKDKIDVRVATTANITLSAPQTIDWVSIIAWDRVLVKDQSTASQNGIYLCAAGAWTRATDFDANTNNEVDLWASVWVSAGTVNIGRRYSLTTTGAITVWSTNLTFTQTYPVWLVDISCRATQSSGTSIWLGSWWVIWFNTEAYDTSTIHDNVTNNSRLTIPSWQDGKYAIVWQAWFATSIANNKWVRILKNWTEIARNFVGTSTSLTTVGEPVVFNVSTQINMVATDYVELSVYNSSGSANTTDTTHTHFEIQRVG
jgi:hypothetical protein